MSTASPSHRVNWRLLVRYLQPLRWQIVILAAILAATIAMQLATPFVASLFIDQATTGAGMDVLIRLALITIVLAMLAQAVAVAETWVAERISWSATNALREDLAAHLLHLDASFHHAHTPGELIERVDGDVGALARVFSRFAVNVVGNALLMLAILVLLWAVDWRIGLGVAVFVLLALAAILRLRATSTHFSATERQAEAEIYGFLGEYLMGLEDVRSSDARAFVLRRWAELMRSWKSARIQAQMRGYAMIASSQGFFGLALAFALALSAVLLRNGAITLGAVFLVFRYTDMLRAPTSQIRNELQDLQQAGASLGRIEALLSTQSRLVDGPGDALPPQSLGLAFDQVWFGYDPDAPVLRGVSFHLPAQRVLGIVGRTGSGKSTLSRLIPRFYDPDGGAVRLGGIDLRTVSLAAVRSRIGVVTQESHLFSATVRDNLTIFDDSVPDERLADILSELGLADWLSSLPHGLDTLLGPGGQGLSAGQTQALACARLLLRDPDVVILDEPSSKLDPATERLVHGAFARLLAGRTGVVVAHRLSTFDFADDILVLEHGRVLEHGPRLALTSDPTSHYAGLLRLAAGEVAV